VLATQHKNSSAPKGRSQIVVAMGAILL